MTPPGEAAPAVDDSDEILALIESLHGAEQRLAILTADQVDTVSNRAGRTFLLRRAQERLRHSEAGKQAAILDSLPAQVALLDSDGSIVAVNRAWRQGAERRGMTHADAGIGLNYIDVCDRVRGADLPLARHVADGLRSVLAGQRPTFGLEYACHAPEAPAWFELTVTPLTTDHPTGAVVMHQDVTERTTARQAVQQSSEMLRAVAAGTPDTVFVKDAQGRYLLANEAFARFVGRSVGEMIGQDNAALFGAVAGRELAGADRRVLETGLPVSTEDLLHGVAGPRTFLVTKVPYRDEAGMVIGVIGISRDITERKHAEQETRLLANRLNDTLESITDAFITVDRGWHCTFINNEGLRLLGKTRDEVIGTDIWAGFPPAVSTAFEAGLRRGMAAEGGSSFEVFFAPWRAWIAVHCYPSETALSVYFRDVTGHRRDQDDLRELNAQLESRVAARTAELELARQDAEQANRAKSAFLAAMSHEIRTPMNGVIGMIDVLEQSHLKSAQAEIVHTVREAAYALLGIVDDVLDFSKIEAGHFQIDNDAMVVEEVVEQTCKTLGSLSGSKGVALRLYIDPALPPMLGDASRLRQILLNLIGNAVKFSSGQDRVGQVEVRVTMAARPDRTARVTLAVSDNGIGMDAGTLSRLFTPFTQADASTTRLYGGTGLGLSISGRIAELMGGTIEVSSVLGAGSRFALHLPFQIVQAEPSAAATALPLLGLHALVVGTPTGPAQDLGSYLAHAGAEVAVTRTVTPESPWFAGLPAGRHVAVLVLNGLARSAALEQCRQARLAWPALDLWMVTVDGGARSPLPQVIDLDGDALYRSVFVDAVAAAGGRGAWRGLGDEDPAGADADSMPMPLSALHAGEASRLILVAEDNEINRDVIRKQLGLLGYKADIATSGREALEFARQRDHVLLLTDLHMPQMDGYELARSIRSEESGGPRMPIVALTADAMKSTAQRWRDAGMDECMVKPVQLADLHAMLRRWMPPHAQPSALRRLPGQHLGVRSLSVERIEVLPAADLGTLTALVGSDPRVIAELLAAYRRSAQDSAAAIRAGVQHADLKAVGDAAHKLKSGSYSIGASRLAVVCEALERAVAAGQSAELVRLLREFEREFADVVRFLDAC